MNVTDILEDSPNGYEITCREPEQIDEAIRYYLVIMEQYPVEDFPVEFGIIQYALGKLLFGDESKPKVSEERAKRIENSLYHFHQAITVFNDQDYPSMFAVISTMMARMFRERASLISNRSFLADRSSPEDSIGYGVDQVLEAFPILFRSKTLLVEHAICSLEAGWLYVIQSEFLDNYHDDSIREQAATYLERAMFLAQEAVEGGTVKLTIPGEKGRVWSPANDEPEDYPEHIRLLLESYKFSFIEGSALYLLGRLYQGWILDESQAGQEDPVFELQNMEKAFEYFGRSTRPKYLPNHCFLWADAHHRAAITLIKYPKVVNPEYVEHDLTCSDLHMEIAITHLGLALRCNALTNAQAMDLHFHLAQSAISRLQLILDRVPLGHSVTKALMEHPDALEIIQLIEEHLEEARQRVTPASTQTTQDGYLYYFSCLKFSEFRMLEAACKPALKAIEREEYLQDSVERLIDACHARNLTDNSDLHYVAIVQMSQLLLAVKRTFAATKAYGKVLFTLSHLVNRALFNPEDVYAKLSEETVRQVGQALISGARDIPWVKLHFGPVSLNEKITAGYASWSFEETQNVKLTEYMNTSSSALLNVDDSSKYKDRSKMKKKGLFGLGRGEQGIAEVGEPPEGEDGQQQQGSGEGNSDIGGGVGQLDTHSVGSALLSASPAYKATPPKGVPPLNLPMLNQKRVHIGGGEMVSKNPQKDKRHGEYDEDDPANIVLKKKKPPSGAIPLFALGHNPEYETAGESNYFLGPYGRRMRRQVPPTKEMFDIDKRNMTTFAFRNGKANFLLPNHIRMAAVKRKQQVKESAERASLPAMGKIWGPGGGGSSSAAAAAQEAKEDEEEEYDGAGDDDNFEDVEEDEADTLGDPPPASSAGQEGGEGEAAAVAASAVAGGGEETSYPGPPAGPPPADLDEHGRSTKSKKQGGGGGGGFFGSSMSSKKNQGGGGGSIGSSKSSKSSKVSSKQQTASIKNRERSATIRPDTHPPPAHAPPPMDVSSPEPSFKMKKGYDSKTILPVAKKQTMLAWIFSSRKDQAAKKAAKAAQAKKKMKKGIFTSLFGASAAAAEKVEDIFDDLGMWASAQCFYTFMMMSRLSRVQLVLRCSKLHALEGERTNYQLYHMPPKYINTYYALKRQLTKDCAGLVVPPTSLKELSHRSFLELQALFKSQVKICRKLDDLEHFMYNKVSKTDNFLPFVMTAPVFTRDISDFDSSLLDAERMLQNLSNENMLARIKASRAKLAEAEAKKKKTLGAVAAAAGKKDTFSYDSVSSAANTSVLNGGHSEAKSGSIGHSASLTQKQEEEEEVAVGKMSLSLSQSLDGANYLRGGQQGSRDMFERYLAQDECMMIWHMPVVPTQPLQVILVWRDNSESLYDKFSSNSHSTSTHHAHGSRAADAANRMNSKQQRKGNRKENKKNRKDKKKNVDDDISDDGMGAATAADGDDGENGEDTDDERGIVMEIAKSDLDTSHMLQYLQAYLEALHSRSEPMKLTMTTDALRALSCALSLTEFLHMIPPHVKSLVICCPTTMRIIPWHLLLIEQPNNKPFTAGAQDDASSAATAPIAAATTPSTPGTAAGGATNKPVEVHLMEKFYVRLGPSLALFELNESGGRSLRHSGGLHRLCALDGEVDGPERSAGARGTDLEVACCSHTWSADPGDYHVLSNDGAVPRAVQTGLFGDGTNDDEFMAFKKDIFVARREKKDHIKVTPDEDHAGDFVATIQKTKKRSQRGAGAQGDDGEDNGLGAGANAGGNSDDEEEEDEEESSSSSSDDDSDDDDPHGGLEVGKKKKKARKLTFKDHDRKALSMCRVLHVAAFKRSFLDPSTTAEQRAAAATNKPLGHTFASIALPQYDKLQHFRDPKAQKRMAKRNRDQREDDARHALNANDVVQQVFVKNCALCVLSRFGLTDDVIQIKGRSADGAELVDVNCEFIEAMHLAGAKTVLSPIWGGLTQGLATLAHLVFLIRFYSILPSNSRNRLSVVETCRHTQLWLRDATADEVIAFIHKAPVPKPARKLIIDEMESYVTASLTPAQQKQKLNIMQKQEAAAKAAEPSKFISPDKQQQAAAAASAAANGNEEDGGDGYGNRIGGDQKFFNHFLYWGSFAISGIGGNVHHPKLTEDKNEGFEEGHIPWDDKELNNMAFEASVLRMEGKVKDARELERLIRQLRIERFKSRISAAKATGARARRGIMDTLDFLDKKLLDQDSDEVSVSDDSEEERQQRKMKKENKARESDSDEYDDEIDDDGGPRPMEASRKDEEGEDDGIGSPAAKSIKGAAPKFTPQALDLGNMKATDIGFDKWRAKVGGMKMEVRQPVINARALTQKADNYEYNMMKHVKESADKIEEPEDYDEKMEKLYQKKEREKARRLEKAAKKKQRGSDDDEDEDEEDDEFDDEDLDPLNDDEKLRKIARRKQLHNADEESESDVDSDEEESEDDDENDDDGLYQKRKKLRKKKDRIQQGKGKGKKKKMSRFAMAMQDVRGNVRSYSSVVKTISDAPKNINTKDLIRQAIQKGKRRRRRSSGAGNEGGDDEVGHSYASESEDGANCVIS